MSFISYAQNFEDVMLWRALGHIAQGCYVDIGAQHPEIDSVSLAFYQRGWRGVHIEPVAHFAELLRKSRPDEKVLEIALGDSEGNVDINVIADTGLSTAVADYAERALHDRGFLSQLVQVPQRRLDQALGFLRNQDVHWMKIDVEGFESRVLRGWDPTRLRPWIIVVEAVLPGGVTPNHQEWEPLLIAADYEFVYFDGLNRFYCAAEHRELVAAFAAPPNVADDIQLTVYSSMLANVNEHHEQERAQYEKRIAELSAQAPELVARLKEIERLSRNLVDMQTSRSWRLTAPLRAVIGFGRSARVAWREGRFASAIISRLRRVFKLNSTTEVSEPTELTPKDLSPQAQAIHTVLINPRNS